MITKNNFKELLRSLEFEENNNIFSKSMTDTAVLKADFKNNKLIYPKDLTVHDKTTSNFSSNENFVVFECVHRLLLQGYEPKHIELEKRWQLGHGAKGGKADILIKDNGGKSVLIIECKTAGNEFNKAWNEIQTEPTQIFSYVQQAKSTKFIAIYASDFIDNKLIPSYYLINLQDNKELLKNDATLKSYKKATTTKKMHTVWCETYQKDYATIGLFEDNQPYKIGKTKFKTSDLKNITSIDIQGKYHEFATILRKYSVSGRENAFDKLVNLFLCKATDEKNNTNELKLYWKGAAYDNPFDFQDRLQRLYKNGMEDFLGEEITYIDNKQIDDVFSVFKDKPNSVKESIKQILKEQKFFTNNDFAFIDVHNEKLFYQNFEVLLAITKIIQDISLLGSEENQFLGDMFEGFLDQGVKQHEGQFFTPMPIVKFIVNSLPSVEKPKVIDYACGSGHFLNEYINTNKNAQITGIEKEYRLSKISKVSSLMYDSNIDIIYTDALAQHQNIKNHSYDVLVANPPYSVKGFLETLSDKDRKEYQLSNSIESKSYSKNGSIECFFIERAKQLLTSGGIAGIILPSSILNKDTPKLYIKTREIILKHFEIKAIAEFGTGTFGKTGTNTATFFLKRRNISQNLSQHLEDMINIWFDCDFKINKVFDDDNLLSQYCQYIKLALDIYEKLLCRQLDEGLFKNDTFKEYQQSFESLTITRNRRKTRIYKAETKQKKQEIEKDKLIEYIFNIEKDKLLFFGLSQHNGQVIIIKSPSKNTEIKKFLGYKWGGGKGNEGIKYLSSGSINDESLSDEDRRILENLQGVKSIQTPLYNPEKLNDKSKINTLIKQNFEDKAINIPDELSPFVSTADLVDMLDFSRVKFGKEINLSKKIEIESKYPLEKIGVIASNIESGNRPKGGVSNILNGAYSLGGEHIHKNLGTIILNNPKFVPVDFFKTSKKGILKEYDVLICKDGALTGKVAILRDELNDKEAMINEHVFLLRCNEITAQFYVFNFLFSTIGQKLLDHNITGSAQGGLNSTNLKNIKIPLPPLKIQKQIVTECEKVDKSTEEAQQVIQQTKNQIEQEINTVSGSDIALNDLMTIARGASPRPIRDFLTEDKNGVNWIKIGDVSTNSRYITKTKQKITKSGANKSRVVKKGDFVLSNSMSYGRPYILGIDGCVHDGWLIFSSINKKISKQYLYNILSSQLVQKQFSNLASGTTVDNLNIDKVKSVKIPVPNLKTQQTLVNKIAKLEINIAQAQDIIDNSSKLKNSILKKYL